MKLISRIVFFIYLSSVNSYRINRIEGISGTSELINFDSTGSAYVVANNNDHRKFCKINPAKEISWKIDIPSEVYKILINKNNIYVIFWPEEKELIITIFNEKNFQFQKIDSIRALNFLIINEGDVFYNRDDGVQVLTGHVTNAIKNLEEYNLSGEKSVITDNFGNIYLAVNSRFGFVSSIAVLTKKSIESKNFTAVMLPVSQDHHIMDSIFFDENHNLWAITWDFNKTGYVKKFINDTLEIVVYDEKYQYHTPLAIKDRIYLISRTDEPILAPVYFITVNNNNEILEIPELANLSFYQWYDAKPLGDRHGNAYFGVKYPFDFPINSPLALVKYGEVKAIGIEFGYYASVVSLFFNRDDEVLWVLTDRDGIFYVKKGETKAEKVESDWDDSFTNFNLNMRTNEVFVLSENGLYFLAEDVE